MSPERSALSPGPFASRHIGPNAAERRAMLEVVGAPSLDALIDEAIPAGIRLDGPLPLADGLSEHRYLRELRETAARNQVFKSYRSEEHTSELQSLTNLVCRLLLEKKKIITNT